MIVPVPERTSAWAGDAAPGSGTLHSSLLFAASAGSTADSPPMAPALTVAIRFAYKELSRGMISNNKKTRFFMTGTPRH